MTSRVRALKIHQTSKSSHLRKVGGVEDTAAIYEFIEVITGRVYEESVDKIQNVHVSPPVFIHI